MEVSSAIFSAATELLPILSVISLIRIGRWKDGQMNVLLIASSLTEKLIDNFKVVAVHIMVAALASTVVIARRSNVRKSPVHVMVGLVNVCFILKNNNTAQQQQAASTSSKMSELIINN